MRLWIPLLVCLVACRKDDYDGDGYVLEFDCDDADASVYPEADEVCDEVDQDCDGEIDEEPVEGPAWFTDSDADGYGDGAAEIRCVGRDGQTDVEGDCNDGDREIYPGAGELCNGIDDDCDDVIDPDTSTDAKTWYLDNDGDTYGAGAAIPACELDGAVSNDDDCDDEDDEVNPEGFELCDEVDNNCDGAIDGSDPTMSYEDLDGDEFGNPETELELCEPHEGWVAATGDCDDSEAAVNPDAAEVCDEIDNDCDTKVDPPTSEDAKTWYPDGDGDGVGDGEGFPACTAEDASLVDGDCDDADPDTLPDAPDRCSEGDPDGDRNCDGKFDGCEQCHPFEPVGDLAWEKEFAIEFEGTKGTEIDTGKGVATTSTDDPAFAMNSVLEAGERKWDMISYTSCSTTGELLQLESAGDYTDPDLGTYTILAIDAPPRQVLPKYDTVGTDLTWSFDYDLMVDAGVGTADIATIGTSTEADLEMVTVPAGTFLAWKITSTYTQDFSDAQGEVVERSSTFWYAEALGLVKEVTIDTSDDRVVIMKELTAFSGL